MRLGSVYGCQTMPETGAKYQLSFHLLNDRCSLYIDTTGDGLHKRGYRAEATAAPIRETLAAAMVYLSRRRGDRPLCDPLCGSGTILIEAALMASCLLYTSEPRHVARNQLGNINAEFQRDLIEQ